MCLSELETVLCAQRHKAGRRKETKWSPGRDTGLLSVFHVFLQDSNMMDSHSLAEFRLTHPWPVFCHCGLLLTRVDCLDLCVLCRASGSMLQGFAV
jgi:hypothetical protein